MIVFIISTVRKVKSEKNVSLKEPIKQLVIECPKELQKLLEQGFEDLAATTISQKIIFGKGDREISAELKIRVEF